MIDEDNRESLRIECGTSIPLSRVVRVLDQLVEMFVRPEAIRLDNGPDRQSGISLTQEANDLFLGVSLLYRSDLCLGLIGL